MTYGFQLVDSSGNIELSSAEATNGGVYVGQFTLPINSDSTTRYITFNGSTINSEIHSSPLANFLGRTLFFITYRQGSHYIRTGLLGQDLYTFWPRIEYTNIDLNYSNRTTSGILVFVR